MSTVRLGKRAHFSNFSHFWNVKEIKPRKRNQTASDATEQAKRKKKTGGKAPQKYRKKKKKKKNSLSLLETAEELHDGESLLEDTKHVLTSLSSAAIVPLLNAEQLGVAGLMLKAQEPDVAKEFLRRTESDVFLMEFAARGRQRLSACKGNAHADGCHKHMLVEAFQERLGISKPPLTLLERSTKIGGII